MLTEYETPTYTPAETRRVTRLSERNLQILIQRGFFARATRPGRGVHRQFALSDQILLAFLKMATEARIPLSEASLDALHLFPAMEESVPPIIMDVIRSSDRPDLAPQVFAVFHDGRTPLIVTKQEIDEAWAPIHEGEAWSVVINVTRLVCTTIRSAKAELARRAGAPSAGRQCRQAESGS